MAAMGCGRVFLPNSQLCRGARHSRLSANHKGDNEMKPGSMHRSRDFYSTAVENIYFSGRCNSFYKMDYWFSS